MEMLGSWIWYHPQHHLVSPALGVCFFLGIHTDFFACSRPTVCIYSTMKLNKQSQCWWAKLHLPGIEDCCPLKNSPTWQWLGIHFSETKGFNRTQRDVKVFTWEFFPKITQAPPLRNYWDNVHETFALSDLFHACFFGRFGTWLDFLTAATFVWLCEILEAKGSMFKLCQVRLPAARGSQKGMLNFLWPWRFLGVPPVFWGSETHSFGFQFLSVFSDVAAEWHCGLDSPLCWLEDHGPSELFCLMLQHLGWQQTCWTKSSRDI